MSAILCFSLFAVIAFSLSDMPMVMAIVAGLWAHLRRYSIGLWHWSATWKWDIWFGLGWLGMITINEYRLALACLTLCAFGLFSNLVHWQPGVIRIATKVALTSLILCGYIFLFLVTLANKGDKPWSGIPEYLASQILLPPNPEPLPFVTPAVHPAPNLLAKTPKSSTITHPTREPEGIIDRLVNLDDHRLIEMSRTDQKNMRNWIFQWEHQKETINGEVASTTITPEQAPNARRQLRRDPLNERRRLLSEAKEILNSMRIRMGLVGDLDKEHKENLERGINGGEYSNEELKWLMLALGDYTKSFEESRLPLGM